MTSSVTGGTSDGQVGTPLEGHRATGLRPRRLVGRDAEIAEVIERLALTPLTTVTGPGGVGKTSLALTVAAAAAPQFSDGVFVIWLASLRSAEHMAGDVAAQVGMPRSGGQAYEDSLTQWLADRDVLLVLDNCEHVVSAVADLVEGLTARLPRLRVLATSREPLWVLNAGIARHRSRRCSHRGDLPPPRWPPARHRARGGTSRRTRPGRHLPSP